MHSALFLIVLACAAGAWLYWYVQVKLPQEFERKCRESMKAFSTAVEMRSPLYKGMSERIARISRAVGKKRGLPKSAVTEIELASHLRGIGLCAVPFALLNVPHPNEWTYQERIQFERHPLTSAQMIEQIPALRNLRKLIYQERPSKSRFAQESKDIIDYVAEYVWLERWEGPEAARRKLASRASFAQRPQIVKDLIEVIPEARETGSSPQN